MAENSTTNPQVRDSFSPLSTLSMQAIRRFGDFAPGAIDGDVSLMFLEFANLVLDDVRMHPYHDGSDLDYYQSIDEARPVPDPIMVAGLIYHYAMQQGSQKVEMYMPMYHNTLNQQMWYRVNGNTKIQMRIPDGGTNPENSSGQITSPINGLTRKPE